MGRVFAVELDAERGGCYRCRFCDTPLALADHLLSKVKKHIKGGEGHEGGILTVEAPLHASNVRVLDPVTGMDMAHFMKDKCSLRL